MPAMPAMIGYGSFPEQIASVFVAPRSSTRKREQRRLPGGLDLQPSCPQVTGGALHALSALVIPGPGL
jgi:hypothetical protein